jgi:uncharacterized membrane protein YeaQ/YmgE (transglycosylase-associated protein family)
MELTTIIAIATMFVTWILGAIAKRSNYVNKNLIPIQNIAVGLIVALVEYLITKDFETAIALSGIFAGGVYDIPKGISKLIDEDNGVG